jgi:hypothetical protein
VVKATDGTGGTATFTVQARSLRIAPAGDLSIELLSSGYQLKAMLSDGTNEIAADVTWKLDKEPVLSLGKVNLSASGLLTASGLAVVGNATVRAISNDNPAISATGDITFVSVLTIL